MNCLKCQTSSCFLGTSTRSFKFLVSDKSQTWSAKPHLSRMSWHLDITIWRLERVLNRALHGLTLLILSTSLKPRPKTLALPFKSPLYIHCSPQRQWILYQSARPWRLKDLWQILFCFLFLQTKRNAYGSPRTAGLTGKPSFCNCLFGGLYTCGFCCWSCLLQTPLAWNLLTHQASFELVVIPLSLPFKGWHLCVPHKVRFLGWASSRRTGICLEKDKSQAVTFCKPFFHTSSWISQQEQAPG